MCWFYYSICVFVCIRFLGVCSRKFYIILYAYTRPPINNYNDGHAIFFMFFLWISRRKANLYLHFIILKLVRKFICHLLFYLNWNQSNGSNKNGIRNRNFYLKNVFSMPVARHKNSLDYFVFRVNTSKQNYFLLVLLMTFLFQTKVDRIWAKDHSMPIRKFHKKLLL